MIYLLILLLCFNNIPIVNALNETNYYAKIISDEVYLYRQPLDLKDESNLFFILPETYFVKLIESANSNFYKVSYSDLIGYVKKDSVQPVLETPTKPYLTDINFRIYAEPSRDLRSSPSTDSGSNGQVTYVPLLSKNLTYYGKIKGEELIEGRTTIWYYCKYSADKDYFGYVYSDFCDQLTEIKPNTEEVTYITTPIFQSAQNEEATTLPLENKTTGIIIAILSIPALIFIFILIKGSKIIKTEHKPNKEIIDY